MPLKATLDVSREHVKLRNVQVHVICELYTEYKCIDRVRGMLLRVKEITLLVEVTGSHSIVCLRMMTFTLSSFA